MSRQMVRQRPPADDDLQATPEQELRKPAQAAAGTTKLSAPLSEVGTSAHAEAAPQSHAADRAAYFTGHYAGAKIATGADTTIEQQIAALGLPDALRHCVWELIHILRDQGIGAAL